jgi:uncharacterized protein (TIGR03437 family)
MRVTVFVLTLAVSICEIDAQAQPAGAPPRLSLIRVSTPTPEGDVTITGMAGSVPVGSLVGATTLNTGHFTVVRANSDGSFTARLFAPAGSTIQVKADTTGELQRWLNSDPVSTSPIHTDILPGTVIRVADPPASAASGQGIPFGAAGLTNPTPPPASPLPAWTLTGTIDRQSFQPGETLRVQSTLRIVSGVLQQAGVIRVVATLTLERLTQADGSSMWQESQYTYASIFLTPTGLPIERQLFSRNESFEVSIRQVLSRPAADRAEATLQFDLPLPLDLPAGYYRPYLNIGFEDENGRPDSFPKETTPSRLVTLVDYGHIAYLPLIRIGSPAPPRLFWMLLADTPSNGSRGVRAIEDRGRYGFSPRVTTQSETYIIPRLNRQGQAITYRLEPFAPGISLGEGLPREPRVPFRFPSGQLRARIQRPDGLVITLGPAPFMQARLGAELDGNGPQPLDVYQLSTMDPRFEVQFTQDGYHLITLEGSIEDIWGGAWSGGGSYEVFVARTLALDTATLPGAPFEVGDSFNPGLVVSPAAPANIEVRFRLAPNSDPSRMIEKTVTGRANRFGYFQSPAIPLDQPGEYRVDIIASFRDESGRLWMGSRTWGGVVARPNPLLLAHGRRGIRNQARGTAPQWFIASQVPRQGPADEVFFPFHSGDVMWMARGHSTFMDTTFQDPIGNVVNLLRPRAKLMIDLFNSRSVIGETPLFSSRPDGLDPHLDPSKVDLWGYSYVSVHRPLVRVREEVSEDQSPGRHYWTFRGSYLGQIGAANGDQPNDIKFQYGGVVLRGPAIGEPQYAIYGSLFVLVPDNDPGGGSRVFPPFQGNGGGPSGGPVMKLKGQDIDLFIHLTGVRPGSVLEVGDNFSIAGAVGPPLPALVSTKVTTPSGRTIQFSGRANRVGYYYRPQDDFAVTEPGIYAVEVRVTFDGQTSAGQVTTPLPTGDVLGSANGRFFVYVVPRDSPLLTTNLPETMTVAAPGQLDITARAPAGQNLTSGHVTTMMPGFLLQTNQLTASAGSISYRYEPATLARDFPNLDLNPPADVITLSLFGQTTNAQGQPSYAARVLALHGQEFFNLTPSRAPARAVASVSAASFSGTTLASESIVAAFGTGLAINTQAAESLPLPTSLAGTTITVKDSAGVERQAPLFFVSTAQINYQMPPGTASGAATVTIINRYGEVSAGTVQIAAVAPGLFAANANGQGVAAAVALRIKADGTQQHEPVARFDAVTNRFVSVPIDLGPGTDQVFLIPFGTGLRFGATATATIGGANAEVLFAGVAPGFVGLDQANVRLSRSLIGRGEVDVVLMVDGRAANTVRVNVR